MTKANYFYAYLLPDGDQGVATTWEECEGYVKGEPDARFRKFRTQEQAELWLVGGADYRAKAAVEAGIYFDSGTGRGRGVEISVTDEKGNDLLWKVVPKEKINRYGKHWIFGDVSNNRGELLACFYALQIALADGIKNIFGDSKLVLEYWSKGYIKKEDVDPETVVLVKRVKKLRDEFESDGGTLARVHGDENPADLGFHQ
ncbi:MAG: ribonuclease H family protein [Patescibacteria group bacterium]